MILRCHFYICVLGHTETSCVEATYLSPFVYITTCNTHADPVLASSRSKQPADVICEYFGLSDCPGCSVQSSVNLSRENDNAFSNGAFTMTRKEMPRDVPESLKNQPNRGESNSDGKISGVFEIEIDRRGMVGGIGLLGSDRLVAKSHGWRKCSSGTPGQRRGCCGYRWASGIKNKVESLSG